MTAKSQPPKTISRRTLFAGAGTVGAIAAAASVMPVGVLTPGDEPQVKEPPAKGGGYHLSEHVKHYYRTTLV